ncbi:MAG: hypothetical protein GY832_18785 [Chloroflexi bacterium]|nr:hypothetical protein [Chloroflexota bacterium]
MATTRKNNTRKAQTATAAPQTARVGTKQPAPAPSAPADSEPTGDAQPKKKPGAPRNNRNAIRHGLKSGSLPKDCRYVENRLNDFRRKLEDAVLAAKGEVSIPDAACIQTAGRWERHAALAQRWLTKEYDNLKPLEKLKFSSEISRASAERDKSLKLLELDVEQESPWDGLTLEVQDDD